MNFDKNWFQRFFGFDESIVDRKDISNYCKNKNTGIFYEINKSKIPIEFLEKNRCTTNIVVYMCKEIETNNICFFSLNSKQTFDFYIIRNVSYGIEIQQQNSDIWTPALPSHEEAYHTYSAYTKLNSKHSKRHSPFFSKKYYQVVLFLSKHKSLSVEHKISYDIIYEQYEAVHTRDEKAMFQASSLFNYLQAPNETTYPSDGIRNYICNPTDQGTNCALVSPHATLFRNWLINSDDQQKNGLANVIHTNKLYKYITINNGYASLTSYAKQNIAHGYGISPGHIVNTYSYTLHEIIENTLCIGITKNPVELKCHPFIQNENIIEPNQSENIAKNIEVITAWCSCFPLQSQNTDTEKKALAPLIKAILFATYYLTLHTAVYHPFVQVVYLTNIGKKHNIPIDWVMDAIQYALYSFRFAPLKIVILHDYEFDTTLQQIKIPFF